MTQSSSAATDAYSPRPSSVITGRTKGAWSRRLMGSALCLLALGCSGGDSTTATSTTASAGSSVISPRDANSGPETSPASVVVETLVDHYTRTAQEATSIACDAENPLHAKQEIACRGDDGSERTATISLDGTSFRFETVTEGGGVCAGPADGAVLTVSEIEICLARLLERVQSPSGPPVTSVGRPGVDCSGAAMGPGAQFTCDVNDIDDGVYTLDVQLTPSGDDYESSFQ